MQNFFKEENLSDKLNMGVRAPLTNVKKEGKTLTWIIKLYSYNF